MLRVHDIYSYFQTLVEKQFTKCVVAKSHSNSPSYVRQLELSPVRGVPGGACDKIFQERMNVFEMFDDELLTKPYHLDRASSSSALANVGLNLYNTCPLFQ